MLGNLLHVSESDKQFLSELRMRRRCYEEARVQFEELASYESKGYSIHKSLKKHIVVRRDKDHSRLLEDRIWLMFYDMGFQYLNPQGMKVEVEPSPGNPRTKQIDVMARDGSEIVVVECKSSQSDAKRSLRSEISEFSNIRAAMEKSCGREMRRKVRVTVMFGLWNIMPSENDLGDAKGYGAKVWTNEDIEYHERLADLVGKCAKYQLLGSLHPDEPFKDELEFIPAVSGKFGERRFYLFCISPEVLLKIGYVHHRFAHQPGESAYQRMLSRGKLSKIDRFLSDGGYFANNVIVNLTRKPDYDEKEQLGGMSLGRIRLASFYSSAWIIDGQHRLYGYANNKRRNCDVLPVLAFEFMNDHEQGSLFVDINKTQKSVEANLLWDLYSEIFADSDDVHQQKLCSISELVKKLNHGQNSPFRDTVYIPSLNASSESTNITMETICTAIKKGRLLDPDMLFREDFDKTITIARDRISEYFGVIKNRLNIDWDKGEHGFSRSKNGVAVLFILFRELVKFAANKDIRIVNSRKEWEKYLPSLLEPVLSYIEDMSDRERADLRTSASSEGGRMKVARRLAKEVQTVELGFAPGMELDFGEGKEEGDDKALIENAELNLRYYIRDKLKETYGEDWYNKGVPKDVKDLIDEKLTKKITKYPFLRKVIESTPDIKMDYTDIVNLGRIITWNPNWPTFEPEFLNEDNVKRKVDEFQAYRNEVFHLRIGDGLCKESGRLSVKWIQQCLGISG